MSFYIIPALIEVKVTLTVDADLLAFLGMTEKIQALTAKLAASQTSLQAVVTAHPDPDPND